MDKQLLDKLVGIIMDESSNAFERNAALVMLANIDDPSALSALKAIYKASENKDPFIRTYIRSRMANFGLEDLDSGKPTRRSSERREKPWWRFWRKSFEFREAICQPLVPPPGAMSSSKPSPVQPPRVFINYSHDSPAHCDWILSVAQQLRRDGIDVELDQFHQEELVHWPRWCEEQLRPENSDFVLCICTPEYKRRVEGRVPADVGKGVFWEGTLIYNYLYDEKGNPRCVPVLVGEDATGIPTILGGFTRFELDVFGLENPESGYAKLYRLLTKQSVVRATPLGEVRKLPAVVERQRRTDFTGLIEELHLAVIHIEQVSVETKADTSEILNLLRHTILPASVLGRPHNLPLWMSPEYFIGRGAQLQQLRNGLTKSAENPIPQPQIIFGGGGTGKSRLAIQVTWLLYLERKCDMAFFISAETPSELDTKIAELDSGSLLNLYKTVEPPRELEVRKAKVIEALQAAASRWILTLDNVDSREARDAVEQLMGALPGGRFLVTSRREDWPSTTMRRVQLPLFNTNEAVACLMSRYWEQDPTQRELADFERLADQLGYLPLALSLASSYMQSRRFTPARYLKKWHEEQQNLLDFVGDEDTRSVVGAFYVSYWQLSPKAVTLFQSLAWLASAPFPRTCVEDAQVLNDMLAADVSDVVSELQVLSLIERDQHSISLHKLVLACARAIMSEDARRVSLLSTLKWLWAVLPDAEYNLNGGHLWTGFGPHLDSVLRAAEEGGINVPLVARICGDYGVWNHFQARFGLAEDLMRRALAIDETSFGSHHPNVARDLNNLASLLQYTNRLAEAEPLMRRALAIDEANYGPHHPEVARDLNNLASLLKITNRLAQAEPLMRRALAIDEAKFGPHHPSVARHLNNLACLLKDTNRLGEAEPLMRRALAIDEASFGPDHPEIARDLNNLAQLLQDTNRLGEAEPLMRRALAIHEASFGPEHPTVATELNNLAHLLQATNRLGQAEPLMRRALAIHEASFGPHHPNVARALNNLALLLQDTNRLGEAEPLMRRALAVDEGSFGPDHPEVARDLNNLASLFHATGRLGEAEPLMGRALAIHEASFGPEHPTVATDSNNLAVLLQATNRLGQAEPLMRRALAIDETSFGPYHPNVARDLNNLAQLLQATNRLGQAEPLMRRTLAIDEAGFGPYHPDVARDLNNLAQLLKATNRLGEAEPLMRRALAIDEACFGPHHPNVAIRLCNLASILHVTNRLGEAEPLMRRALVIDEASFGSHHPNVARDLNNLASLLQDTNRLGEAETLMRRTLAIDEAIFGLHHPRVATDLNNLAQLLQDTNRLAEVEPLMRRALAIDEASFGPHHPEVATDLNNLAELLRAINRLGEAEPLMRRALAIDEASFGSQHPKVARDLNNLAQLLKATNRLGKAEPLMYRALAIDEASFGPDHPRVATDLNNLAQLLQATNRPREAEPILRRSLSIRLKSTKAAGHIDPKLPEMLQNYYSLLRAMELDDDEFPKRVWATGMEAGFDPGDFRGLLSQLLS